MNKVKKILGSGTFVIAVILILLTIFTANNIYIYVQLGRVLKAEQQELQAKNREIAQLEKEVQLQRDLAK